MRKLFFMMLAVCTLASCSKDDGGGDGDKAIQIESGQTSQVVFADNSSGGGVTFKTTGAWTSLITESTPTKAGTPDWVTIDPASGNAAGSYTINITLDNNYTGSNRTATITINCGGDKITISITQDGKTEAGVVPEEPTPTNKLVSKIIVVPGDEKETEMTFTYDSSNRITSIKSVYIAGDASLGVITTNVSNYVYEPTFIKETETVTGAGYDQKYFYKYLLNSDGYISKLYDIKSDGNEYEEIIYKYINGYLSEVSYGNGDKDLYVWENGVLKSLKSPFTEEGLGGFSEMKFEYGTQKNISNIDLNKLQFDNRDFTLTDISGKRSPFLFSKGTSTDPSYTKDNFQYRYESNAEGYVTKVFETNPSHSDVKEYCLYEIYY